MIWRVIFFVCILAKASIGYALDISIKEMGALGDGKTINTKIIQSALDQVATSGGGTVKIDAGVFKTGTLFIKSNTELHLSNGAVLLGSENLSDYTPLVWGHNKDRQPWHLIVAKDAANVRISGLGKIDGNGPAFWQPRDESLDPQWIMAKDQKISPMMEIWRCRNVEITGVTLTTGGGWTLHLYDSDLVRVQGIKILNNLFAPNGDGIDISGCEDVVISDCIIKTCDDAVCLKTMGDSRPCKRVTVTNCVIECSCAALKIGNESFRNIEQVVFSNCVITNSNRAVGIYAEGAGEISDVLVSNIVCDTKAPFLYNRPIHISLFQREMKGGGIYGGEIGNTDKFFDHEGRQAKIKNITISNFRAQTDGRILITAEPGRKIENLILRDIVLSYPFVEDPVPCVDSVKSWQFSPKNPEAKKARAAMVVENVDQLLVDNFMVEWPNAPLPPKEWQIPKRIANGTLQFFYPIYTHSKQCDMSAMWFRGVNRAFVYAPFALSSHPAVPNLVQERSNVRLIAK